MIDLEMAAMELVGNAGESRSLTFEALRLARKKDFDGAREKLAEAKEASLRAHGTQTQLICAEADGNPVEIGLLMVHAQDHLMTAMLARELVEELIGFYEDVLGG